MNKQEAIDQILSDLADFKRLAGTRQGIINKLEAKVRRLEAENAQLRLIATARA